MKKIKGFTLAEVLITLAIIGVVAALTIPSVIVNYQKNLYVTQLKKEYNYISNAFRITMAKEGVSKVSDTKLLNTIPNNAGDIYPTHLQALPDLENELKKMFNITQIIYTPQEVSANGYSPKYLNGGSVIVPGSIMLADGSGIVIDFFRPSHVNYCGEHECKSLKEYQEFYGTTSKFWNYVGTITVDVNGPKGPNIVGRDIFTLHINDDGTIYPHGGVDWARYIGCYSDDLSSCNGHWSNNGEKACNPNGNGLLCAARIMEEGWKMNY